MSPVSLPASFCSLNLFPIKSYSSPLAFNQSPLHLHAFGAEKASLCVCVDVCYGPEGCSGPRLSSAVTRSLGTMARAGLCHRGCLPAAVGTAVALGTLRRCVRKAKCARWRDVRL